MKFQFIFISKWVAQIVAAGPTEKRDCDKFSRFTYGRFGPKRVKHAQTLSSPTGGLPFVWPFFRVWSFRVRAGVATRVAPTRTRHPCPKSPGKPQATFSCPKIGLAYWLFACVYGCGSNIGTQDGTLGSGNMDQNLRSPGGLILTHTHICVYIFMGPPHKPAFLGSHYFGHLDTARLRHKLILLGIGFVIRLLNQAEQAWYAFVQAPLHQLRLDAFAQPAGSVATSL